MSHVLTLVLGLLVPVAVPPAAVVVDGKTAGVFYGWSPVLDLWGNVRRSVWTLRADGIVYFGAPEGSFEDFAARPLTDAEKAESGRYSIDGGVFRFTYRDGSPGEGKVVYAADGGIEKFTASTLNFLPVGRLTFPLTGYFSSTVSFNNAAYGMSTTAYSCYSFYPNGGFVLESGSGTTIRSAGSYDSLRDQILGYYGTEAKGRVGRFEVKGSGLTLSFEDGTRRSLFLGQIGVFDDGTAMLLIGRAMCEGSPGKFPGDAATLTAEQFTVVLPKGWVSESQDVNGLRVWTLTPAEEGSGVAVLAVGTEAAADVRPTDPQTVGDLRKLVAGWAGVELTAAGEVEAMTVDGGDAVRIPMCFVQNGATVRVDGIYAVKDGRAVLLVALGTEAAAKAHEGEIRSILAGLRFAVDETATARTADFELLVPKSLTATAGASPGTTTLSLSPPGVKEGEFFAAVASQAADPACARMAAWLRAQVESAIPGLSPQGEPEPSTIDGAPAVSLTFGARTAEGEAYVVHATGVVKGGKVVLMLLGGRTAAVEKHGPAVRRAFRTLRIL